jgi:hypothetical protein
MALDDAALAAELTDVRRELARLWDAVERRDEEEQSAEPLTVTATAKMVAQCEGRLATLRADLPGLRAVLRADVRLLGTMVEAAAALRIVQVAMEEHERAIVARIGRRGVGS